jgi:hypothetical protein
VTIRPAKAAAGPEWHIRFGSGEPEWVDASSGDIDVALSVSVIRRPEEIP